PPFTATIRKPYWVDAVRPVRFADSATALRPLPASAAVSDVHAPVPLRYSKWYWVDEPFGLTVPPTVAVVLPSALVVPVTAAGAAARVALVRVAVHAETP